MNRSREYKILIHTCPFFIPEDPEENHNSKTSQSEIQIFQDMDITADEELINDT